MTGNDRRRQYAPATRPSPLPSYHQTTGRRQPTPVPGQGYRIRNDSLDLGWVFADRYDRIRNLAANTAALWLLESVLSV